MPDDTERPILGLDSTTGIAPAFRHIVAGMHVGRMTPMPHVGEFDAVLTVGATEGVVENGLRHRHLHLPYGPDMDIGLLDAASVWVQAQVQQDRKVLVRSEGGKERPALVVADVILCLGGRVEDVLQCLYHAGPHYLNDFRYRQLIRDRGRVLLPHAAQA